jgi:hypothetical protein
MYAQRELNRLAAHKTLLRDRIARHRQQSAVAAAGVLRPLEWCDRALAWWRRASPLVKLVAVPLGLVARRRLFPRAKLLGTLVGWAPAAFGAIRAFTRPRG